MKNFESRVDGAKRATASLMMRGPTTNAKEHAVIGGLVLVESIVPVIHDVGGVVESDLGYQPNRFLYRLPVAEKAALERERVLIIAQNGALRGFRCAGWGPPRPEGRSLGNSTKGHV